MGHDVGGHVAYTSRRCFSLVMRLPTIESSAQTSREGTASQKGCRRASALLGNRINCGHLQGLGLHARDAGEGGARVIACLPSSVACVLKEDIAQSKAAMCTGERRADDDPVPATVRLELRAEPVFVSCSPDDCLEDG